MQYIKPATNSIIPYSHRTINSNVNYMPYINLYTNGIFIRLTPFNTPFSIFLNMTLRLNQCRIEWEIRFTYHNKQNN